MLKEYTLKVTVRVGGDSPDHCDDKLRNRLEENEIFDCDWEITHEEVVEPEVKGE